MLAEAFGFDEGVLARLTPKARARLQRVAWTGVLSTALCGLSAAYGAFLATGDVLAGLGAAAFFAPFVWNLHRLVVSGTGVPLDQPPSSTLRWRPGNAPLVVFAVFAVIAGQPALLFFDGGHFEREIETHRQELLDRHARTVLEPLERRRTELAADRTRLDERLTNARRRLAGTPPDDAAPERRAVTTLETTLAETVTALAGLDARLHELRTNDVDAYRAHLATMSFPVLRLQLVWADPVHAGLLSALFACVVLLPLFARRFGFGAFRDYEFERHDLLRTFVDAEHAEWRAQMAVVVAGIPAWSLLPGTFEDHARGRTVVLGRLTGRAVLERLGGAAP